LAEEARHNGIQQLVADVLNSNKGIVGVLKKLPYEMSRISEGFDTTLIVHLDKLKDKQKEEGSATAVGTFC